LSHSEAKAPAQKLLANALALKLLAPTVLNPLFIQSNVFSSSALLYLLNSTFQAKVTERLSKEASMKNRIIWAGAVYDDPVSTQCKPKSICDSRLELAPVSQIGHIEPS